MTGKQPTVKYWGAGLYKCEACGHYVYKKDNRIRAHEEQKYDPGKGWTFIPCPSSGEEWIE